MAAAAVVELVVVVVVAEIGVGFERVVVESTLAVVSETTGDVVVIQVPVWPV